MPPEEVLRAVTAIGHSRIPIYRGSIGEPLGIVTLRDVLEGVIEGRLELASIMRRRSSFPSLPW